ncbi:NAD-dependent deacetylase 1 [Nostocoides japonicum T1-X7]|uniref:NAD-dependent protein deacetylase n=1 Tax=Nostocoides japonicum T1-X7 TaxID=1194083 RepID=A0A077LTW1_9MICO|nr:NAD-dependent protein deacetylase [Tetrasphaera japonica]CCH76826.1 NAD-dependent deacetylase 1 [Tetrasphaera japonica T1-X7]
MTVTGSPSTATTGLEDIDAVADLLVGCSPLVLTGAGMSTESGIPDYRGPDGQRRVRPMQYAEFVGSSLARQRYWARSYVGWQRFHRARPNVGHEAVAALQAAGRVGPVITQNVDGLHQRAGTRDVIDLHGSLADVVCLTCGDRSDRRDLDARMAEANPAFEVTSDEIRPDGDIALEEVHVEAFRVPTCQVCGRDTLKPDVVFFGESVPKARVERCLALTDAARGLLVLGSSLAVMSGYRFVRRAAARRIPVGIVTHGPTRGDAEATVRLDAPLGRTLAALAAAVGASAQVAPQAGG